MSIRIKPPLKHIAYFGSMLPLTDVTLLKQVLNANGQPFGVDWSGPACNVNPAWPCNKTYYQYLGLGAHNGIDMPCVAGTPIYAAHDGKVIEVSNDSKAGLGIVLWDKVQKIKTVYWHNKINKINLGQEVKHGDEIASVDNTGYSLGNHLHFMLKQTDEFGNTINKDNGFLGAIDPVPYLIFGDMLTKEQVIKQYVLARRVRPTEEEIAYWVGRELDNFQDTMLADDKRLLEGGVV